LRFAFFAPGNDATVWLTGWHPEVRDSQRAAVAAVKQDEWWSGDSAPLLDLQAAQDPFKPETKRSEMKDEFGDRVTLVVIDNASHALIPEQPKAVVNGSTIRSGSFSVVPTGCAMKSTCGSRSSPACCQRYSCASGLPRNFVCQLTTHEQGSALPPTM
jgi:hypothetical protein